MSNSAKEEICNDEVQVESTRKSVGTSEHLENPEKPTPTKASEWPMPKGCIIVEDGESHISVGGFPYAPPVKKPN